MKAINFLNRWEESIFKKYTQNHEPISVFVAIIALVTAIVVVVVSFIMQMIGANISTQETTGTIIFVCALIPVAYIIYRSIGSFPTTGSKIGFTVYILLIFSVCLSIFAMLATIALMIVLGIFVIWLVLTVMGGSSSGGGSQNYNVNCNDLTDDVINGRNVCRRTMSKCPAIRTGNCPYD